MLNTKENSIGAKSISIRFWKLYIYNQLQLVFLSLFLLALVAVSFAVYPAIIGWIFDALEKGDTNLLFKLAIFIILVASVKAFAVYRQIEVVNKLVLSIIKKIQIQMTEFLISSDVALTTSQPSGHYVSRIVNDLNLVRDALVRVANSLIKDSLTLLAMIILMFWYDWLLTILVLCVFPLAVYPIIKIGLNQRKASHSLQTHMEALVSHKFR